MTRQEPQSPMPGVLDVLLRDLHLLWCDGCPDDDWNLADADPELAAIQLACALWELADRGTPDARAALKLIDDTLEKPW